MALRLNKIMPGKNFGKKGQKRNWLKSISKILFSNLGLFIIVSIYACVGAWIYIQIETPAEIKRREKKIRITMDSVDNMKYMVSWLWYYNSVTHTKTEYHAKVFETIEVFKDFVVAKTSDPSLQFDGTLDSWDTAWTFPKSLLFTVTSIAAIGYGHIAPKTLAGRLFTILYNAIGIPLLLVFLANIGDFLANFFQYIYSRLCCRWCRWRRRMSEKKKNQAEIKSLKTDDVGYEIYMPTTRVNVPIVANLCVITVYLMIGGGLFAWWENWDLVSSVYFSFITLVTIGFGDLVPGNSFTAGGSSITSALKMLATVLYILFGMSLLSMCINLMQEQLMTKARWFALEVGLIEEEIDPMTKYKYKKSKRGTVMETHPDRDGNRRLALVAAEQSESTTKTPPNAVKIVDELRDM